MREQHSFFGIINSVTANAIIIIKAAMIISSIFTIIIVAIIVIIFVINVNSIIVIIAIIISIIIHIRVCSEGIDLILIFLDVLVATGVG